MTTSIESLQRRLRAWSPKALELSSLRYGELVTGRYAISEGSPEAAFLEHMLRRAERRANTRREQ